VAVPDEFVDPAAGGLNLPGYGHISPMYHRTDQGVFAYARLPSRTDLVFTVEWTTAGIDPDASLTLQELHDSVHRVMGADLPVGPVDRRQHPPGRQVSRRLGAACRRRRPRALDGRAVDHRLAAAAAGDQAGRP